MKPTALILSDISDNEARLFKASCAASLFRQLGFSVEVFGANLVDQERAMNLETQLGVQSGVYADYADRVLPRLMQLANNDGVVIVLEEWHQQCFKGTLDASQGKIGKMPVVELWIDYPSPFAAFRVYANRFTYTYSLTKSGMKYQKWWIAAPQFVQIQVSKPSLEIQVYEKDVAPFSTDFLLHSSRGIPVIAPDWGSFSEEIVHGMNGFLYRTEEGKKKAHEEAKRLPSRTIFETLNRHHGFEVAAAHVANFLKRISRG